MRSKKSALNELIDKNSWIHPSSSMKPIPNIIRGGLSQNQFVKLLQSEKPFVLPPDKKRLSKNCRVTTKEILRTAFQRRLDVHVASMRSYADKELGISALAKLDTPAKFQKVVGHVILRLLDRDMPTVRRWNEAFSRFFNGDVFVNSYTTPAFSQTLPRHYDFHDVAVIQMEGAKDWEIFERSGKVNERRNYLDPFQLASVTSKSLQLKCRLEPGMLLFIPRGYVHCARSVDVTSTHITVALSPLTAFDVLESIVFKALSEVYDSEDLAVALKSISENSAEWEKFKFQLLPVFEKALNRVRRVGHLPKKHRIVNRAYPSRTRNKK